MDTNRPDPTDREDRTGDLPTAPLPEVTGPFPGSVLPPHRPAGTAVTDALKATAPDADGPLIGPRYPSRRRLGVVIAAAGLAVMVVAGVTAWGVSTALASSAGAPTAAHVSARSGATSAGARKHGHAVQGTVTAISSSSWTVRSAAGKTFTVTVGPSTAYGTAKNPASASSFAVGQRVGIIGTRNEDTVDATRIVHLGAKGNPPGKTGTPAPAATPMPGATT